MRILHEAAANEASHDSGESYGRPPCHQDTRKEYLSRLDAWSCATECSKPLWMCGPAGTGKSSIAQSLCEQLHTRGCLGGGFFFKRGHPSRSNAQKLFPTLAYQLATVSPQFRAALAPCVAKNPALVGKSLPIQLQTLILQPYHDAASKHPFVMVIDGLDECEGENLQQHIMRCAMDAHSLSLRFLVVSRPESHIQAAVPPMSFDRLIIEGSFQDIRRYLGDEFEHIRTTHEAMLGTIQPWPDYKVINTLVGKSSGHFIYAATVIRFIGDRDWNPLERLDVVMGAGEPDADSNSPFAGLDQLYIQILKAVPSQFRLRRILAIASAQKEVWKLNSFNNFSVDNIAQILQTTPVNIHLTLCRLRSVMWIPKTDSERELFSWHHASFPDFLNNPERAGEFFLNATTRSRLAVNVIKVFCDSQCLSPSFEGPRHVAEHLEFNFITKTKLSSDMAKSLDCVNLDFFFGWRLTTNGGETKEVLNWLECQNAPRKLIQHWEDIVYMAKFDVLMMKLPATDTLMKPQELQNIRFDGVSPRLLRIIQLYALLEFSPNVANCCLAYVATVLDVCWPEMMTLSATALRSTGEDLHLDHMNDSTTLLIIDALKPHRIRESHPEATLEVVAKRLLLIRAHDLQFSKSWTCILRSCPPTEDLLYALRLFVMHRNFYNLYGLGRHIYHIRAWLMSCPSTPLDMLEKLNEVYIATAFDEQNYEADWMEWRQRNGFLQQV
ncbi:hypothetical protein R3P38DRAFT_1192878 [Favolaschia claudopus]|uniref:Nephrocystin 3-like N-terminal domain-containing protein n=1 Tax=Favolaschia claudopus TaxID=2862362 RepID=A0AAW0E2R9_9AGAR